MRLKVPHWFQTIFLNSELRLLLPIG